MGGAMDVHGRGRLPASGRIGGGRPARAFAPVDEAAAILAGFDRPWGLAGGWALDLFLGRKTRDHEDVDVATLRRDQAALRAHLAGWSLSKVIRGTREPWRQGERLAPPVHEIHAVRATGRLRRLEILLIEADGDRWAFRRDPRVTCPLDRIALRSRSGVPFLAPEIVLLYKTKDPRPTDELDFRIVEPPLAAKPRRWLRDALRMGYPDHPWIIGLG